MHAPGDLVADGEVEIVCEVLIVGVTVAESDGDLVIEMVGVIEGVMVGVTLRVGVLDEVTLGVCVPDGVGVTDGVNEEVTLIITSHMA
jgi:hypothetical protein